MSQFVIRHLPSGVKFDLKAPNGEVIATSESYSNSSFCRKGIESVRKNAPGAKFSDLITPAGKHVTNPRFELYQDRAGEYRFRLRARNGEIIAVSEGYVTKNGCLSGIESVRLNAPDAEVVEEF